MKWTTVAAGMLAAVALAALGACTAAPAYDGPQSRNFNGTRFVNTTPMEKSAGDFIKLAWGAITDTRPWPTWVDVEQRQVPFAAVRDGLSVTYINHATFLIQVDGLNILTDPIYAERASPFRWAGPRRVHAPGVPLEQLPEIDLVLISHNHYDHLDAGTLQRLAERQAQPPLILAGLGNGRLFSRLGLTEHRDMDWEESIRVGDLEVIFTESRHRSGRGLADQMKTLWGAFVLKTSAGNIYFAGDTGYGPHLHRTGERHGPFALSLLPIGAYEPRWFMADVHLDPFEAVQAHLDLRSRHSIAMHFGTFRLTYEGIEEPIVDLRQAMLDLGIPPRDFDVLKPGETALTGVEFNLAGEP